MYFYFYWLILFREERDRMWCEVYGDIVELMMDADHHTVNKSAHNGETLITPHGEMITEEKQYLEVDNIPGCYVAVM